MAPQSVARGAPRSGDRAAAGMPGRAYGTLGRPHPATGSHLPAEETAPPFAVAFRVVAPCPAPQKPHTPPRPTAGFRLNLDRFELHRDAHIPVQMLTDCFRQRCSTE